MVEVLCPLEKQKLSLGEIDPRQHAAQDLIGVSPHRINRFARRVVRKWLNFSAKGLHSGRHRRCFGHGKVIFLRRGRVRLLPSRDAARVRFVALASPAVQPRPAAGSRFIAAVSRLHGHPYARRRSMIVSSALDAPDIRSPTFRQRPISAGSGPREILVRREKEPPCSPFATSRPDTARCRFCAGSTCPCPKDASSPFSAATGPASRPR